MADNDDKDDDEEKEDHTKRRCAECLEPILEGEITKEGCLYEVEWHNFIFHTICLEDSFFNKWSVSQDEIRRVAAHKRRRRRCYLSAARKFFLGVETTVIVLAVVLYLLVSRGTP